MMMMMMMIPFHCLFCACWQLLDRHVVTWLLPKHLGLHLMKHKGRDEPNHQVQTFWVPQWWSHVWMMVDPWNCLFAQLLSVCQFVLQSIEWIPDIGHLPIDQSVILFGYQAKKDTYTFIVLKFRTIKDKETWFPTTEILATLTEITLSVLWNLVTRIHYSQRYTTHECRKKEWNTLL